MFFIRIPSFQEEKLHPSLANSVGKLKRTLTDILEKMKRKLEEVQLFIVICNVYSKFELPQIF